MDVTKILVSIDERLLERIDKQARAQGLSRSAFLSRLAARELDARQGPGRAAHVRRALGRIDDLFATRKPKEEASRAIRQERESH